MISTTTFQQWCRNLWAGERGVKEDLAIMGLGLNGEAGEAAEYIKKYLRGDGDSLYRNDAFARELGDTLYYLTRLADMAGYTIEQIMEMLAEKLTDRRYPMNTPILHHEPEYAFPAPPSAEELSALQYITEASEQCGYQTTDFGRETKVDVPFNTDDIHELAERYAILLVAANLVAKRAS